jgi:hypothetical protein
MTHYKTYVHTEQSRVHCCDKVKFRNNNDKSYERCFIFSEKFQVLSAVNMNITVSLGFNAD